ncbi:MarR family winged helix-turn-helix transcriptional regulator [Streptomyces sp. NPDC059578]|uniref:MarR family winged helix-turn-helix transcriptional regulator n=1 Tax=unclassified Streptomyces TaxID=2593676 RepID=UPI003658EE76
MEYTHDDQGLARQPIGYWSWATYEAVVPYIRAGLAEQGLTQPQWWVLNQLAEHPDGRDLKDLAAFLGGYLDVGEEGIEAETRDLVSRGLAGSDENERIRITDPGETLRKKAAEFQAGRMATIHDGVSDEEYVAALKVLQRMIDNVGGRFWHH